MSTTIHEEDVVRNLGPWTSKLTLNGVDTGGWFNVMGDLRATEWLDTIPDPGTVLECGSLEGGHTAMIAMHPRVKRVVGVDVRESNIRKCKFVHKCMGITNSSFIHGNLEELSLKDIENFDAMFCSGVFYHLRSPYKFFRQIDIPYVFLGTHFSDKSVDVSEGLHGCWYVEHGMDDALSGAFDKSFWIVLDDIEKMIDSCGYEILDMREQLSKNGPWVDISMKRVLHDANRLPMLLS